MAPEGRVEAVTFQNIGLAITRPYNDDITVPPALSIAELVPVALAEPVVIQRWVMAITFSIAVVIPTGSMPVWVARPGVGPVKTAVGIADAKSRLDRLDRYPTQRQAEQHDSEYSVSLKHPHHLAWRAWSKTRPGRLNTD